MNAAQLRVGGKYNWRHQDERLAYMGVARYPGDRREWHQFAKAGEPGVVWCEVLESDLAHFEATPATLDEANTALAVARTTQERLAACEALAAAAKAEVERLRATLVSPACGVHGPIPCQGARCICGKTTGGQP